MRKCAAEWNREIGLLKIHHFPLEMGPAVYNLIQRSRRRQEKIDRFGSRRMNGQTLKRLKRREDSREGHLGSGGENNGEVVAMEMNGGVTELA